MRNAVKKTIITKRKCIICSKSFNKYVVMVKDSVSGKWKTKTVHSLKLAKDVESKFKTEILEGNVFDKKKQRFQKIQQMRGMSTNSNGSSYEGDAIVKTNDNLMHISSNSSEKPR